MVSPLRTGSHPTSISPLRPGHPTNKFLPMGSIRLTGSPSTDSNKAIQEATRPNNTGPTRTSTAPLFRTHHPTNNRRHTIPKARQLQLNTELQRTTTSSNKHPLPGLPPQEPLLKTTAA